MTNYLSGEPLRHPKSNSYLHYRLLAWNAVFAVAEDFVFWARVQDWKRVHPPQQIVNLAGERFTGFGGFVFDNRHTVSIYTPRKTAGAKAEALRG